jgi:hypothetical protein
MYTPAGGNVAYPTPAAAIPGAPPRAGGGGGGRAVLLVVAGLIGVASVVAIVFALHGSSGGSPVKFDTPANPPPTATAATTTATAEPVSPPTVATVVPPLSAGPTHPPVPGNPQPGHPGQPLPPGPARYNGPECVRAREYRALGHAKEAQQWALACIAKGGQP